jgi:phthiocerol/phenolphthiocerol synthesis type-I polyketide synthase E
MTSNDAQQSGNGTGGQTVEPIAIIGLACRVPGASNAAQFWRNLVDGVESVRFATVAEQESAGVPEHLLRDPNFIRATAWLDDFEYFDAPFFGMSAREAELRDPQHRLFLELTHTALEDSGYDPARYPGEIGVYAGCGDGSYEWLNTRRNRRVFSSVGPLAVAVNSHPDFLATLISYKLNLRGPSFTMHTACSTSLVTLHVACEALRNGECDMAVSGGASIDLPARHGYLYVEDGIYSPDGHCRAFDARAAGTLWGHGGGVLVLKRLSDALADGDHVRAVVLGNAINNDGATKVSFTAPSQDGQAAVVTQALAVADIDPRTITYVEAHGTGTEIGDPIEIAALSGGYGHATRDTGWCAIGSVKTNIGHLGAAAGVAGVIKVVLALEHGLIPASLNYETPNPRIDFASSPFYVNSALSKWEANGSPRRAGVSSFGMGGTNAHIILEEAPAAVRDRRDDRQAHLLRLSARTPTALAAAAERLAARLAQPPEPPGAELNLADVAYTLRVGRRELGNRLAVVGTGLADAAAALADRARWISGSAAAAAPSVAFMFSGQGAQYAGMGARLYREEPVFRDVVDECAATLSAEIGLDLREVMFAGGDGAAEDRLRQTAITQPALFTIDCALAQLWRSWGVEPGAMVGHSVGEYVAATLAGVFTLPDALRLVASRGRLMQGMPPGAMLAVQLDEAELRARVPDGLSVAAVNGPGACVVAGPVAQVGEFARQLAAQDVGSRPLRTSHAFHSPMMEPILADFRAAVAGVDLRAPALAFGSNVTGTWITPAEATDPSYWARHLRETVRFGDCLATLLREGDWLLVECGPGRQLCGLARMQRRAEGVTALPSLPHRGDKKRDLVVLYAAAGRLWTAGVPVDLQAPGGGGHRVPLPTYQWERKYHWIKPEQGSDEPYYEVGRTGAAPRPLDEWFAVPAWRQLPPGLATWVPRRCLVFTDPAGAELVGALRRAGADIVEVHPGDAFGTNGDGSYTLRPAGREDYGELFGALAAGDGVPARIVHAWALTAERCGNAETAWRAQDRGFFSLLFLTQALAAAQPETAVHVDVLTAGTQDVSGTDLIHPEHATVAGIAKVAPLEMPWLTVRHIDLDPAAFPLVLSAEAGVRPLAQLVGELCTEPGDDPAVALRAGRRWQRHYEPAVVPTGLQGLPAGVGLRDRGVYVVTGGLGGIGITLAEEMARQVHARLVLISRSGLPPREEWDELVAVHGTAERAGRAIAAIKRMESAGAQVLVLAADVTSPAAMREVRARALERFGRVDGIVHAAGVPGGGMAEVKDRAAADAVMRPKVAGTLALAAVFGDLRLDFVVLCSSLYAIAGEFGQVDYCAANNFMDAYACSAHGWRTPVISMNWGSWLEVGMSAEVAAPAAFRALQRGDKMTPIDHPVLTRSHAGDEEMPGWCSGVMSAATHWVLADHRIDGVPVMPGTALLETVRRAVEAVHPAPSPRHVVELRDVAFVEPMSVPEGTSAELRAVFAPGADGLDFMVVSLSGGTRRTHAQGSVTWVAADEAATADIEAIRRRCSLALREGDEAVISVGGMLSFGPHWGNLSRVHEGADEELALIEATDATAADLSRWVLHPALLDEATAYGRTGGDGRFLPLGYGRLTVRRPLPARFWSHLRHRDTGNAEVAVADLTLLDGAGRELVSISDFTLRHVDPDALAAIVNAGPAGAGAAGGGAAGGGETLTGGPSAVGIRPADGAEVFRRLVSTDLGAQIVISVVPIEKIIASSREFTQETIEEDLDTGAAGRPVERTAADGYVAPRNELEAMIARIWAEVLGGGQIGVTDDFFEVGGNSLIAVQLISHVRKELGVRLPMRSIFDQPTVAGAAALIGEARRAQQGGAHGDGAATGGPAGAAGNDAGGPPAAPSPPGIPRLVRPGSDTAGS